MSKVCPKCRKINPSEAHACDGCGTDLSGVRDRASGGGVSMFGAAPSAAGQHSVYGSSTGAPAESRAASRARLASDLAQARSSAKGAAASARRVSGKIRIADRATWPGPAQPARPWANAPNAQGM